MSRQPLVRQRIHSPARYVGRLTSHSALSPDQSQRLLLRKTQSEIIDCKRRHRLAVDIYRSLNVNGPHSDCLDVAELIKDAINVVGHQRIKHARTIMKKQNSENS